MDMAHSRTRSRLVTAVALALAVAFGASSAVVATSFMRSAKSIKAVKTVTDDVWWFLGYNGGNFADVSNMSLTLSVPSGEKALFIVTFSAVSEADNLGTCGVEATINGAVLVPGSVAFTTSSAAQANSMQWIAGPEPAGSYTVKIRAHEGFNSATPICGIEKRTMIVERALVS